MASSYRSSVSAISKNLKIASDKAAIARDVYVKANVVIKDTATMRGFYQRVYAGFITSQSEFDVLTTGIKKLLNVNTGYHFKSGITTNVTEAPISVFFYKYGGNSTFKTYQQLNASFQNFVDFENTRLQTIANSQGGFFNSPQFAMFAGVVLAAVGGVALLGASSGASAATVASTVSTGASAAGVSTATTAVTTVSAATVTGASTAGFSLSSTIASGLTSSLGVSSGVASAVGSIASSTIISAGGQLITTGHVNLKSALTSGVIGFGSSFVGNYVASQAGSLAVNLGASQAVSAGISQAVSSGVSSTLTQYATTGTVNFKTVVTVSLKAALSGGAPTVIAGIDAGAAYSTVTTLKALQTARAAIIAQRNLGALQASQQAELNQLEAEIAAMQNAAPLAQPGIIAPALSGTAAAAAVTVAQPVNITTQPAQKNDTISVLFFAGLALKLISLV